VFIFYARARVRRRFGREIGRPVGAVFDGVLRAPTRIWRNGNNGGGQCTRTVRLVKRLPRWERARREIRASRTRPSHARNPYRTFVYRRRHHNCRRNVAVYGMYSGSSGLRWTRANDRISLFVPTRVNVYSVRCKCSAWREEDFQDVIPGRRIQETGPRTEGKIQFLKIFFLFIYLKKFFFV